MHCNLYVFLLFPLAATTEDENYKVYQIWLRIKYLWGLQGPTLLGHFPKDAAWSENEMEALNLKQKQVDDFRTKIMSLLKFHSYETFTVQNGDSGEGGMGKGVET